MRLLVGAEFDSSTRPIPASPSRPIWLRLAPTLASRVSPDPGVARSWPRYTGLSPNRYAAAAVCVEHGARATGSHRGAPLQSVRRSGRREQTTCPPNRSPAHHSRSAAAASCASCGAPLADDQRYCLQCGERIAPPSSVLLGGPPSVGAAAELATTPLAPAGYPPPGAPGAPGAPGHRAQPSAAATPSRSSRASACCCWRWASAC